MISSDSKITTGFSAGLLLAAVSFLVLVLQMKLVIQSLSPELAGVWFLFLTFSAYFALFDLGFSPTLSREIAFKTAEADSDGQQDSREIHGLIQTCFRIFLFLGICSLAFGLLFGHIFFVRVVDEEFLVEIKHAWVVFCVGTALNIFGAPVYASLYGLGDVAIERLVKAGFQLVGFGLIWLALELNLALVGLAAAWALQNLLARLTAFAILRARHQSIFLLPASFSRRHLSLLLMPSLNWAVTTLGAVIILNTDNIIIATMLSPAEIPAYEVVAKIIFSVMALSLLFVNTTMPFLSRSFKEEDTDHFLLLNSRNCRFSLSLILFTAAFLGVNGDRLFTLISADLGFIGFEILWVLLTLVILEVHHTALASAVMATGHLVFYKFSLLAAILNVIFSLLLVQKLGVLGVALGSLFAQLLTNNWYAPYVAFRRLGISLGQHLSVNVLPVLFFFSILFGVNILFRYFFSDVTSVAHLAGEATAIALVGAWAFIKIVLTADESGALRKLLWR